MQLASILRYLQTNTCLSKQYFVFYFLQPAIKVIVNLKYDWKCKANTKGYLWICIFNFLLFASQ